MAVTDGGWQAKGNAAFHHTSGLGCFGCFRRAKSGVALPLAPRLQLIPTGVAWLASCEECLALAYRRGRPVRPIAIALWTWPRQWPWLVQEWWMDRNAAFSNPSPPWDNPLY